MRKIVFCHYAKLCSRGVGIVVCTKLIQIAGKRTKSSLMLIEIQSRKRADVQHINTPCRAAAACNNQYEPYKLRKEGNRGSIWLNVCNASYLRIVKVFEQTAVVVLSTSVYVPLAIVAGN